MSNASSGRLRSTAIAPPWVRTSRCSASRATRSLRIVTAETPNWRARSVDPGAAVLLDDPGDVLLALASEDVARRSALAGTVTPLLCGATRGDDSEPSGFDWFPRHSRPYRNAMSRR